jgi:MFS family permease
LFDRYGRRAFILTPLASALISIPLIPVFALSNSALASAVLLIPLTYFGTLSFGAAIAALPSLAPNRMRAQLVAAYMLVGTIVGQGGGPWIIAVFTDFVVGEPALIRYSIAAVSTAVLAAGAAVLAIGLRRLSLPHRADAGATD